MKKFLGLTFLAIFVAATSPWLSQLGHSQSSQLAPPTSLGAQPSYAATNLGTATAQATAAAASAGDLVTSVQMLPSGHTQVIIVDASQRSVATYHVDSGSGVISLKSVRSIRGDLLLDEFNSTDPSPEKVRAVTNR